MLFIRQTWVALLCMDDRTRKKLCVHAQQENYRKLYRIYKDSIEYGILRNYLLSKIFFVR